MATSNRDDGKETNYPNQDVYLAERKLLIDGEKESARTFDKAMLTLSAGALGLSITFIRYVAPHPRLKIVLFLAWLGFGIALTVTILGLHFSQLAFRRARDILDDYQGGKLPNLSQPNCYARVTNIMNWLAVIFL